MYDYNLGVAKCVLKYYPVSYVSVFGPVSISMTGYLLSHPNSTQ